eukprot:2023541-Prymnesium_polylepis.1
MELLKQAHEDQVDLVQPDVYEHIFNIKDRTSQPVRWGPVNGWPAESDNDGGFACGSDEGF